MLSDTVQPIEIEEVALIGRGRVNESLATLLRQLQQSTGLSLNQASATLKTQKCLNRALADHKVTLSNPIKRDRERHDSQKLAPTT